MNVGRHAIRGTTKIKVLFTHWGLLKIQVWVQKKVNRKNHESEERVTRENKIKSQKKTNEIGDEV